MVTTTVIMAGINVRPRIKELYQIKPCKSGTRRSLCCGGDHLGPDAGLVRDEPVKNIQAVTLCDSRRSCRDRQAMRPLVSLLLHIVRYGVARRVAADLALRDQGRLGGLHGLSRTCVRPQIPGLSPGGSGPHLTSSGLPFRLSSGFPSSALRFFPFVRLPLVSRRPTSSGSFPSAVTVRFRSPSVSLRVPFPLSNPDASTPAGRFRGPWSRAARTEVTSSGTAWPRRRWYAPALGSWRQAWGRRRRNCSTRLR